MPRTEFERAVEESTGRPVSEIRTTGHPVRRPGQPLRLISYISKEYRRRRMRVARARRP